jgi:exopolysaccharide biosynthesis protein
LKKYKLSILHSDSLEKTSQIAKREGAIAGINGSFFKMRGTDPDYHDSLKIVPKMEPSKLDKNRSVVYLRENNSVISENAPDKSSKRKRNQQGSIAVNNGFLSIYNDDSLDLNWEHQILAQDVISTGPVMVLADISQKIPNDAFCNDRHPRTAVGKKSNGAVLLFVVDGRSNESAGMSIPELQRVMRWLGCIDAINLDGGGSSTLFVKGQPYNGVVNYPSDNKKFDHLGEREVANALLLIRN